MYRDCPTLLKSVEHAQHHLRAGDHRAAVNCISAIQGCDRCAHAGFCLNAAAAVIGRVTPVAAE
ncbi:MAG: hypothetical protein ACM31L_05270 [Actinomycetota bacterium]